MKGAEPFAERVPHTELERKLARLVIELCINSGHEAEHRSGQPPGIVPVNTAGIPDGQCACELVPDELVPEEYR